MKIELTEKCCEMIAQKLAQILRHEAKPEEGGNKEEYLTTQEAAAMLRVSTDRMRHLKDKFPHIKGGGSEQGKLLFLKSAIIRVYGGQGQ